MRAHPRLQVSLLLASLFATQHALAQEAEVIAPVEEAAPTAEVPEPPSEAIEVEPAPVAPVVAVQAVEDEETEAPAPAAPQEGGLPDWLDGLSLSAFADVYAQGVWTLDDPFSGDRSDVLPQRPYTHIAGFALSFLGLDLAYDHEDTIGARIDVRFGTSAPRLLGPTSGLPDGMQFVKQLFVWWRPLPNFQIDFGEFDTIYGAEVSERSS